MTTGNKTDFYAQGPATLGLKGWRLLFQGLLFPNMKVQVNRRRVEDIAKMEAE
jgi:hypothetical protein